MIATFAILLGVYLLVAAWAWWFVISTPKIGTRGRPRTMAETMEIARRDGAALSMLALAWLPMLVFVGFRNMIEARKGRIAMRNRATRGPKP